ncbi:GNAT family N-acetyltransferase [Shimia ponticola]|uniref:GNAT family N-acetyltransferase n=1 Tax=Shimia ponticola TaxID=2582893 RepID=UPI0011BFBEC6|nr:N-acetyltransferase [Shimia ponticola]
MRHEMQVGDNTDAIAQVFRESFAASEGPEEGDRIASLAARLMAETPVEDLRVVTAWDDLGPSKVVAAILFTRLRYPDPRCVFLLSPVAVLPDYQRKGVGQTLITAGLQTLQSEGIDIAVTYGDPAFYARIGFQQVTIDQVPAPYALALPHGWQAQSLRGDDLTPLAGPAQAVAAWADPELW